MPLVVRAYQYRASSGLIGRDANGGALPRAGVRTGARARGINIKAHGRVLSQVERLAALRARGLRRVAVGGPPPPPLGDATQTTWLQGCCHEAFDQVR